MITRGLNLFTTSPSIAENEGVNVRCCACCTSPFLGLCKPLCKYRKATYTEFIENALKR